MKSNFDIIKAPKVKGSDKRWALRWRIIDGCDLGENYYHLTDLPKHWLEEMSDSLGPEDRKEVQCYNIDVALKCAGYELTEAGFRFATKREATEARYVADTAAGRTQVWWKELWEIEALAHGWSPPDEV